MHQSHFFRPALAGRGQFVKVEAGGEAMRGIVDAMAARAELPRSQQGDLAAAGIIDRQADRLRRRQGERDGRGGIEGVGIVLRQNKAVGLEAGLLNRGGVVGPALVADRAAVVAIGEQQRAGRDGEIAVDGIGKTRIHADGVRHSMFAPTFFGVQFPHADIGDGGHVVVQSFFDVDSNPARGFIIGHG